MYRKFERNSRCRGCDTEQPQSPAQLNYFFLPASTSLSWVDPLLVHCKAHKIYVLLSVLWVFPVRRKVGCTRRVAITRGARGGVHDKCSDSRRDSQEASWGTKARMSQLQARQNTSAPPGTRKDGVGYLSMHPPSTRWLRRP